MKKHFLTCIMLILCISGFSQKIDKIDLNGKPDGKYVEKIGGVEISGDVLDGMKTGTWVETHPQTELPHYIIQYKNDQKDGLFLEIDKQATLLKKIDYKDNKKNGAYYQWYKGGRLAKMYSYKNDKLDGPSKICYTKGPVQEESNYKDGKRDGITIWYDNIEKGQGPKIAMYTYKDGLFEGVQETYYENGKLKSSKMFSNNKQNGPAVEYYDDGSIQSESKYKDGELSGRVKEYKKGQKRVN